MAMIRCNTTRPEIGLVPPQPEEATWRSPLASSPRHSLGCLSASWHTLASRCRLVSAHADAHLAVLCAGGAWPPRLLRGVFKRGPPLRRRSSAAAH